MKKTKSEVAHEVISLDYPESFVVIKYKYVVEERKDEEDDPCSVDNILIFLKEEVGLKMVGELWLDHPSYDRKIKLRKFQLIIWFKFVFLQIVLQTSCWMSCVKCLKIE